MGWFFNLFSYNDADSASASEARGVTSAAKSNKDASSSVRKFFKEDRVATQVQLMINMVMGFPAKPYHRSSTRKNSQGIWPHRIYIINQLQALKSAVHPSVIDTERADPKILLEVLKLCNDTIPLKLRELELLIMQENWNTEDRTYHALKGLIADEMLKIAQLPTKRSTLHLESQPTQVVISEPEQDAIAFPDIEPYSNHSELHQSLSELKKDWESASGLPLDSEDSYIIEMVGSSYLPDALTLFNQFCKRTKAETNPKALAILTDQIKLIHQQVQLVLSQNEEDHLTAMQTHTEFLRMKNNQAGISDGQALQLQKLSETSEEETENN